MLMYNYGLMWRRERVFWGRGSNAGHLNGLLSTATTSDPVDFRDQQGIYVLYDDNFNMVYAGQAGSGNQRLFDRLKQHTKDQVADRWSRFSWFGIRKVNKDGSLKSEKLNSTVQLSQILDHMEAIIIASAEPPHNKQGGRFGSDVQQYLQQYDADNLGPEMKQMIQEIYHWE